MSESTTQLPRVGMMTNVRGRFGMIQTVNAFDTNSDGRLHSIKVEYLDHDQPATDQLIWEREVNPTLAEATTLPDVISSQPMNLEHFEAMTRAAQWSATTPFFDFSSTPKALDHQPICAPSFAAIQLEDYQLFPALKALSMPRVSLLIADDTGLGKTIEAGLVITELTLKRRIRKMLIICPPNLRHQWKDELKEKFGLDFDILDQKQIERFQKTHGFDANPWRSYEKIITSSHFLKQPHIVEQFRAASNLTDGQVSLPWDLLVVDEAHNFAPVPFGEPSDLYFMLRGLAPLFEHKVFLTATPHNGHRASFTGLLEVLDPTRFSKKGQIDEKDKRRIDEVKIRRLKSELNKRPGPKRFAERKIISSKEIPELNLAFSKEEKDLLTAFKNFKLALKEKASSDGGKGRLTTGFALQVLNKRFLSGPHTFGESWNRFLSGTQSNEQVDLKAINTAKNFLLEETDDDIELTARSEEYLEVAGGWLREKRAILSKEIDAVTSALTSLSKSRKNANDARFASLCALINSRLMTSTGTMKSDERLIVFTEFKTTLDYLVKALQEKYGVDSVLSIYGQMDEKDRLNASQSFNDESSKTLILVATDAASEGLNLQKACRYLLHWDIPWNPNRLEQRNGRIDRHGQPKDVEIFHFSSDIDDEVKFLGLIVEKVDRIKNDLGSMSSVLSRAVESFFQDGLTEAQSLTAVDSAESLRKLAESDIQTDQESAESKTVIQDLNQMLDAMDLKPASMRRTLVEGLKNFGPISTHGPDADYRIDIVAANLPRSWEQIVDDTLRISIAKNSIKGPIPKLVFDSNYFVKNISGRPIFKSSPDTTLMHLGHPFFKQVIKEYSRIRFPAHTGSASRWALVKSAKVPEGYKCLLEVSLEEMAVNELRESFHHWVRRIGFGVKLDGQIEVLNHAIDHAAFKDTKSSDVQKARILWGDAEDRVLDFVTSHVDRLTKSINELLPKKIEIARSTSESLYQSRFGEIGAFKKENSRTKLERELAELKKMRDQGFLFEDMNLDLDDQEKQIELEIQRRSADLDQLLETLTKERERVLNRVLPLRFSMKEKVRVFPVGVLVVLKEDLK